MNVEQARTLLRAGNARLARTDDGTWIACVSLQTQDGPIRLCASASEATLRALLARRARAMQQVSSGGFSMASIAQAARKLARAKAVRRLMATADRVLADRRVRGIMGIVRFVPGYGTAAYAAYDRARAAARVVHQYQQGDQATRQRVHQAAAAAARGQPAAIEAMRTLHTAWQGYQTIHGRGAARPGPSTQTSSGGALGSARARGITSLARLSH